MRMEKFGKLTGLVLDRDYVNDAVMLNDLGIHQNCVASINEVAKTGGILTAFIAVDPNSQVLPARTWGAVCRWHFQYSYRRLEGGPRQGDYLILREDLKEARTRSRGRLEG